MGFDEGFRLFKQSTISKIYPTLKLFWTVPSLIILSSFSSFHPPPVRLKQFRSTTSYISKVFLVFLNLHTHTHTWIKTIFRRKRRLTNNRQEWDIKTLCVCLSVRVHTCHFSFIFRVLILLYSTLIVFIKVLFAVINTSIIHLITLEKNKKTNNNTFWLNTIDRDYCVWFLIQLKHSILKRHNA